MSKLQVLYVQLVGFNKNKFMFDIILKCSMKVSRVDFNVKIYNFEHIKPRKPTDNLRTIYGSSDY